jgi:nicotinate-nucleotide adenylyltransferase
LTRRIGLLGGSFDPIHCGHLDMGLAAESALELSQMIVIPANVAPHRTPPVASSYHRFAMTALAVQKRARWTASDMELRHEPPSYTADTLKRFHERGYSASNLFFVIGADAFADIATWKDYPQILDRAQFAVVSRPGCSADELPARLPALASRMMGPSSHRHHAGTVIILIDAPTADVSSTAIRQRRAQGLSIAGLVDARVQQHIEQHGLYTSEIPGRRASDAQPNPAAGRLHGQS